MSNIYIQEPPSNGKVLLKTTVGDIDVELWSKETPKSCRNFVQLCLEGYYDGTAFHRVVKDFIVQGGDPTDSGEGGESIYGAPFKDEFHSRLRFVRRGLVAMANAGPHDNGSQFFFTMAATPELQNKHTIFGKVVGDTLFNMLKLQEVEVDATERPQEPHRIISTEVLNNPFDDIVPRQIKKVRKEKDEDKKIKSKSKATKNFSLLSFGDEAEDDEEQVDKATESFRGKSKSSHDLTDDPRLSSIPAVEKEEAEEEKRKKKMEGSPEEVKPKKSEPEEGGETKVKAESPEEEVKKKADVPDETKKVKPDVNKDDDKKKRRTDASDSAEKKKSPGMDESEGKKKKVEGEEEHKRSIKEEGKEEGRKKKTDGEASHEGRKRKGDDSHKEDRKKRSREGEDEERKKKKGDAKEEESRKKRKGEEEREKEEPKKKTKTEVEPSSQAGDEEKNSKEDVRRKLKKEKEESPKGKEPKSLLGFVEESKQNRMEELKKEQRRLQRDIRDFSKRSASDDKVKVKAEESEDVEEKKEDEVEENDLLAMVKKERQKYKSRKKQLGRRQNREESTLAMLAKFQSKLAAARTVAGDYDDAEDEKNAEEEEDADDMSWMRHKLHFEDEAQRGKVIDANVNDDDRYTISDPRNPLTQRRRETSKKAMREKR